MIMINEKFYNIPEELRQGVLDNYIAYTLTGDNKNLKVIVSHSDLDGVTSALNIVQAYKMIGNTDVTVFLERTSRKEYTSQIVERFIQEHSDEIKKYDKVEFMIADRMFIDLSRGCNFPENVYFSWFDHHEGNVISEKDIRKELGDHLVEYKVLTGMHHSGATITWEAMRDRIHDDMGGLASSSYSNTLKWWSVRVNLWDTFAWKKDKDIPNTWKTIGKRFGTIDKMYDSEKDLFKDLMERAESIGLDNQETDNWVENLATQYRLLVLEEYDKACKCAIEYDNKIILLPAEWKFASNVKELWVENHPNNEIVITYHKSGGTVYTSDNYNIPSYEIARYVGEKYGMNGGGHRNAAGFACLDLNSGKYLSEDEQRMVVSSRIVKALDQFFKEIGGNKIEKMFKVFIGENDTYDNDSYDFIGTWEECADYIQKWGYEKQSYIEPVE